MQPRSEETQTQILQAANHLFSQFGYEATSVAEICQAAGVSKGAFYHHFPTKQAVFLKIMDDWLTQLDRAFSDALTETRDVPQAIDRMAQMAAGTLRSADARLSIFLEFWRQAYHDPHIWQAAIAPYHRYRDFFSTLIQKGISSGSLRPVDPDLAARLFVSLALGLLMQAIFDPQGAEWDQETILSYRLLVEGLRK
jgi:AcrR family transcriptional regulator